MTPTTHSLSKRKRASTSESALRDGDTIDMLPHRLAGINISKEGTSSTETHTVAPARAQSCAATHGEAPADPTHSQPKDELAPSPSFTLYQSIPEHCCYFCRIRGGFAAFNCIFKAGSNTCERCISDKKKNCRPASSDELEAIAARCDRCKTRGFKNCNGQTPCDTCERNNTTHLCRKAAGTKTTRHNPLQTDIPSDDKVGKQPVVDRRPSKESAMRTDAPFANVKDDDDMGRQSILATRVTRSMAGSSSAPVMGMMGESQVIEQVVVIGPSMKRRRLETTRSANDMRDHQSVCMNAQSSNLEVSLQDDPTEDQLRSSTIANHNQTEILMYPASKEVPRSGQPEKSSVPSHNSSTESSAPPSCDIPDSSVSESAVSTNVTIFAEDNEPQQGGPQQSPTKIPQQACSARARRSCGTVSYDEEVSRALSDGELNVIGMGVNVNDSEGYVASASIDMDVEKELESGDVANVWSPIDEVNSADEKEDVDTEEVVTKPKPRLKTKNKRPSTKVRKGIDLSLPPLNNVEDAFSDMAAKAIQLGISTALCGLAGRFINVATMCSGTESPLLALDLLSRGLEMAGLPPMKVRHHFSAEIEVMKQGYIERNFSPSKLFRDVREFIPEESTTATTAYGAEEQIPSGLDILIAGFVCKDLSQLNSKRKDLDGDGESGDTFRALYSYAKRFRPTILLLENVMSTTKVWQTVVEKWDQVDYEATWLFCDTKQYYLPQTRLRMYMIAVDRRQYGPESTKVLEQWQDLMKKLQRQCSSPYEAFLADKLLDASDYTTLLSEPDWALCKLRYDHIRSEQRLGILRPITRWSEVGTVRPPDFANRAWYDSQSSRVHDAIDVAHLQAAQNGYDSLFKMSVWDVSQNVDRFKTDFGILPCITPGGCDFATNRQQALNGSQLLLLQGMPMTKLIFARETQRDCQDLAGNAMSTTVIGASIIAAIISGWQGFQLVTPSGFSSGDQQALPDVQIIRPSSMVCTNQAMDGVEQLELSILKQQAMLSARLCHCEGDKAVSMAPVQVCSSCGHSACARCVGSPKHRYSENIPRDSRTQTPNDFVQQWRPKFPMRLRFGAFPNIHEQVSSFEALDHHATTFFDLIMTLLDVSHHFCIQDVLRQDNGWRVVYTSTHARLELRISYDMEWFLFVNCPADLPGDSKVRKMFEAPIARAQIVEHLLNVAWEFRLPVAKTYRLHSNASTSRCSSWRSQIGLPQYKAETVPTSIRINNQDKECEFLAGDFHLLNHCGTASSSLYKRLTGPCLYLLLDPDLIGRPENDCFVFSHDCSRKQYGDTRMISAYVHASWRPWHIEDQHTHEMEVVVPGLWVRANMRLETAEIPMTVNVPGNVQSLGEVQSDCSSAVIVLDSTFLAPLPVDKSGGYSWALQYVKCLPSFESWQEFRSDAEIGCSCAPSHPPIRWQVNEKGIATPLEDRKAAASFERAIKTRSTIFQVRATTDESSTQVEIALNIVGLVHRAIGRLSMPQPAVVTTDWRLVTDHVSMSPILARKFRLLSNANDAPFPLSPALSYLKYAQPRALTWMRTQELGKAIKITEIEEAIQSNLGWRAEARAQIDFSVRGGVLADLPSFGKTVTSIALIQSEFEDHTPTAIMQNNQKLDAGHPTYMDTAGTLIVCPPHIAMQWDTELKCFLGPKQYGIYNVLLIESFLQLQDLSINDIRNSRVIIVSWSIFAEAQYISHMAQFTAMPEPNITGRRSFDTWLGRALDEIPSQLDLLRKAHYDVFIDSTKTRLEERLQQTEFQMTLPLKVQHGRAYTSFAAMQTNSDDSKAKTKGQFHASRRSSTIGAGNHQIPLLHLMRYNRIIVDEYHYLNDDKKLVNMLASVSVKHILAHKRWVLSGTPALGNFSDVSQIASYLGVNLGRNCVDDFTSANRSDKTSRMETTLVEDFLSQTDIMSNQWHQARHERAQEFLDLFARQNEARLGHISCYEVIMPIELDIGHHAVYLELAQHLISQKTQIKKMTSKMNSDKIDRLNSSLNNSETAEDALFKSALLFETSSGGSELDQMHKKRSEQRRSTEAELTALMAGFEALDKTDELSTLYAHFKQDIKQHNWLGDRDASEEARKCLVAAEKRPNSSAFPELKRLGKDKKMKESKKLLSNLRETARELVLRIRSERFITAIQSVLQPLIEGEQGHSFTCSSPECQGIAGLPQLHLVSYCGHLACEDCLISRADAETCVDPQCAGQSVNLVKVIDLGCTVHDAEQTLSPKLEAIARLISDFPTGDQGIVFAPNDEIVKVLEDVFYLHGIAHYSLRGCRASASAKIIEDFKRDKNYDTQRKVLILNLGSESAAGVNLVNANHIIFVSPLLSKTQYEFDSAMAQAIARSRRYGQTKRVHIHHVIAQRTIDVDILEHRHKRTQGIAALGSSMKMPPALVMREKTKLIKNNKGAMALVPISWLADASARKMLDVDETIESFTSLIKFSETFQRDED